MEITIPYAPRAWAAEVHENRIRYRVLCCHRSAGKTVFAINELIRAALTGPHDATYLYVLPQQNQARRTVFDPHIPRYCRPIPRVHIHNQSMTVTFPNGAKLRILGSDDPENLRGLHVHGIVLDEIDDMSEEVWTVIRPTLLTHKGFCVFIGTPKGKRKLWEYYQRGQNPAYPNWYSNILRWQDTGVLGIEEIESIREEMSPEKFAQEMECFPPGSLVNAGDDVRPIEMLAVGDLVLTHKGRLRPIKRTMWKAYDGDLVVIEAWGGKPLRLTPDHPVRTCNPFKQTYDWVKAKDIKYGDWLVIPKKWSGKPIISASLAELIAWYVSEGSVSQNVISISLGTHETTFIQRVQDCLIELGRSSSLKMQGSVTIVQCSDVTLADFFVSNCGSGAGHKRLPLSIIAGHEQLVFDTLVDGDGHVKLIDRSGKPRPTWLYTTISETLVQQVQLLAASLDMGGTYTTRPAGLMTIKGREVSTNEAYNLQVTKSLRYDDKRADARIRFAKNGILGRVHTISAEHYCGMVYNLSVAEDESYTVNNRAVHNCDFEAALIGSYYGRALTELRENERIKFFDPPLYRIDLEVHSCWDLGIRDHMAVWFYQLIGSDINFVDHEEHGSMGFPEWGELFEAKAKEYGYRYGDFVAPFDIRNRELGTGVAREESGAKYGLYFSKCPDHGVADGIEMVRQVLPKCRFDLSRCEKGVEALLAYRSKLDNDGHPIGPLHDWASHSADSARYGLTWVTQVVNAPSMRRMVLRRG